jgi:hypothetical protein
MQACLALERQKIWRRIEEVPWFGQFFGMILAAVAEVSLPDQFDGIV